MTLDEVRRFITDLSFYPLVGLRLEDHHVFATLARTMGDGQAIQYCFALDRQQLNQANDPASIIAEHVAIATADLDMLKDGDGPLPVWGP